jgi:hypothetical protein
VARILTVLSGTLGLGNKPNPTHELACIILARHSREGSVPVAKTSSWFRSGTMPPVPSPVL